MSAAGAASPLGDERKDGRNIKCRCPLCGGRLALRDGDRGLLAKCWGGCASRDVYRELHRLGYLAGERPAPLTPEETVALSAATERAIRRKIAEALECWNDARPIRDTLADFYLRAARGVDALCPDLDTAADALRFQPRCWHSSPGVYRPALVAKIEHVERGFIGVHITYLALDGAGKTTLDPPRKILGACKGGAVRLAAPEPHRWFCVGEGIESTAACMQSCALPGWAALSAIGVKSIILPGAARMVVICADNDANGVGQRAAHDAAERWLAEGRRVRIFMPPVPGTDWNDVLLGKTPARLVEADHAA